MLQGSRDDLSVGGGLPGPMALALKHGNSVDASFSKEVLNSITGTHLDTPVHTCAHLDTHALHALHTHQTQTSRLHKYKEDKIR